MYELNVKVTGETPKNYDELIAALKAQQAAAATIVEDYQNKSRAVGEAKWEIIREQLKPLIKAAKDLNTYLSIMCTYDHDLYYVIKDGYFLLSHHCDGGGCGDIIILDNCQYPHIFEQIMRNWSNEIERFERQLNETIKWRLKIAESEVTKAKNDYNQMVGGNQ